MYSRKKTKIMCLAIVVITVVFISIRIISNSTYYLERKIQYVKENIKDVVLYDVAMWHEAAELALEEANDLDCRLHKDKHCSNFSKDLDNQLCELFSCSSVKFDEVYTVNQDFPLAGYPEDCCVFRYTITYKMGVYAWVDLAYVPSSSLKNPQWYQQYSRIPESIGNDWYMIVFYGY